MDSQGSLDSEDSQDSAMTMVDESKREILYFAYGSDLSTRGMRRRCPLSTPIGLGHLAGWRWKLDPRGRANVVRVGPDDEEEAREEGGVYGLLYLLPTQDEEKLDKREGGREKVHADVSWLVDGRGEQVVEDDSLTLVRALVYVDMRCTMQVQNEEEYLAELEEGIRDVVENWGFPEEYAERVMRSCYSPSYSSYYSGWSTGAGV